MEAGSKLLVRYTNGYSEEKLKELSETSTWLFPTVSTGNVDQMCIDVLLYNGLCSNCIEKVAVMHSRYLTALCGSTLFPDDNISDVPTFGLEMFYIKSAHVFLIQQRTQPKDGMATWFAKEFIDYLLLMNPKEVVIISAADSTYYDLSRMKSPLYYYSQSDDIRRMIGDRIPYMNLMEEEINGGGLIRMYQTLLQEKHKYSMIISLVTEGYQNNEDAFAFANTINSIFHSIHSDKENSSLVYPPNWRQYDSVFDNSDIM